jgi:hypothetical protein
MNNFLCGAKGFGTDCGKIRKEKRKFVCRMRDYAEVQESICVSYGVAESL